MTIPFKGYKHNTYVLNSLNVVRIDSGVDIVSSPSISGLGSVELNKDRVNYFSGGIRFQKVSSIDSITIKIKWVTDDWADYDYLYVRVYDDANNIIFEKSYGNPDAEGTLTEFDWVTDSFTVGVSGGYIELYLETDDIYPSKCYVDLSTEVYSTTTYEYDAESTSTKGETLDSKIEKYRFTKTIAEALDEVEVYPYYSLSGKMYGFVKWADGIVALRRSVANQSYLESLYASVSPWNMYHYDIKHTGYQPSKYFTIYFGSDDGYFYALNLDGSLKWKFKTGGYIFSSPAIAPDGTIYFGSCDNYFYALNLDGSLKWKFGTGNDVISSPAIAPDGTIYFGSCDNYFYALNPDGSVKWKFGTGDWVRSSPAIAPDGTIYFGSDDNYLYALNPDGSLKWKFKTGYWTDSSPAIAPDGTIYFGSYDNYIYALNPDGSLKWKFKTGDWVRSSPAIAPDGTIYVGSNDNYLYALNPDGSVKWKFLAGASVRTTPAIAPDGTIYVGSEDNYFYALNPDGSVKWKFKTGDYVNSSPAIAPDGTIYVGSNDNYLYAFNSDGSVKWKFLAGSWILCPPALA